MATSKGSILVFRTGQLGDTLVSLPAIQAIRKKFPGRRFILLTDRHSSDFGFVSSWDILGPTGFIDDVVYYTPSKILKDILINFLAAAKELRKMTPEYVFDLSPERTTWQNQRDKFFFKKIVGVPNYVGSRAIRSSRNGRGGKLSRMPPEWKRLLDIVDPWGNQEFRLLIPEEERKKAISVLRSTVNVNVEEGRAIAIVAGSKMPAKRWAKDRFAMLGKKILEADPKIELIVLGGKEDADLGDELCGLWGLRAQNMAGKLSVYGSAAILEKCIVYVGNDTGTMHLAAMVGKPCIVLSSARDYPGLWEPYGENHVVLRRETECAGCMLEECRAHNNMCLDLISVDEVLSSLRSYL